MNVNRLIKFRAWSHQTKSMHNWDELCQEEHKGDFLLCLTASNEGVGAVSVMQFTGLKDKNDRDVYEGDILRYIRRNWKCGGHPENGTDLTQIYKVYWSSEHRAFRNRTFREDGSAASSGYLIYNDSRASANEIEVIGNIYENPQLLPHEIVEDTI